MALSRLGPATLPFQPDPPGVFTPIDWELPLDLGGYLLATPRTATIRGYFFSALISAAALQQNPVHAARERYLNFTEYPIREYMELLVQVAERVHPTRSLRSALRAFGRQAYRVFADSLVGKVALQGSTPSVEGVLRDLERGYNVSQPGAVLIWSMQSATEFEIALDRVYTFADSHHVGVAEGAFRERRLAIDTTICRASLTSVTLRCRSRDLEPGRAPPSSRT